MRIREATPTDYVALCGLFRETDELHAELLPDFFRRPAGDSRSRESIQRVLEARDEAILVAETTQVDGLCHVQIYDTPPLALMVPRRRAHIDSLIVTRARRRQGIGRALVEAACTWAQERQAAQVLLTVWEGNDDASAFYASLGFARVNTVLGRVL